MCFVFYVGKLSMAEPEVHFVGTKRSAASAGIDPLRRT